MSFAERLAAATLAAVALACATSAAYALPSIEWDMDPMLPGHVQNPGGTLTASCTVLPDGTTLDRLEVRLTTPQGGVLEEWIVTDALSLGIDWQVPDSYPDGVYRYDMQYYSVENGLEVSLSEGYLVAGSTTGVCAFKFLDLDEDGVFELEDGEELLADWEICATGPQSIPCQLTSEDGVACWFFITPGEYEFCETLQEFWISTTGVCRTVQVATSTISKVEFGNFNPSVPVEQKSWGGIKSEFK